MLGRGKVVENRTVVTRHLARLFGRKEMRIIALPELPLDFLRSSKVVPVVAASGLDTTNHSDILDHFCFDSAAAKRAAKVVGSETNNRKLTSIKSVI